MYTAVLILHSWLRWGVFAAGLTAIYTALTTRPMVGGEGPADRWGLAFMVTLDLQMLLGLLLYLVLSPNTTAMFADFGAAMRDPVARFWAVEHVGTMLIAVVLVHVGRVLARRATSAASKRTRVLICFVAAMVAVVVATPWPGLANGRPLFRV
jgi:hypothetical protein